MSKRPRSARTASARPSTPGENFLVVLVVALWADLVAVDDFVNNHAAIFHTELVEGGVGYITDVADAVFDVAVARLVGDAVEIGEGEVDGNDAGHFVFGGEIEGPDDFPGAVAHKLLRLLNQRAE